MTDIEIMQEMVESRGIGLLTYPCGSNVTCSGPNKGRDIDLLVHVFDPDSCTSLIDSLVLERSGIVGGAMHDAYDSKYFTNVKVPPNYDFIITTDWSFYQNFVLATEVAKELDIADKAKRITLFKAILYGRL
jgi:hypothetical protein